MEVQGKVTCGNWIKRPENVNLVVLGRSSGGSSTVEIFSFEPKSTSLSSSPLTTYSIEEGDPISIAVHPNGDDLVCSTASGDCKLFELSVQKEDTRLLPKDAPALQGIGQQKCIAFSIDGSRLATGGVDGHLRIFEWPSMRIILDEPRAHKSFRDMDFSLDSEFLASTSTDGSARIWNANGGVPLTTLRRNVDEHFELCRFSKDGTKPFLFCTMQKGNKALTGVWDMSTWNRIGHKSLLKKPASIMSVSVDGKYLALGSKDGDVCVVEVKKMQICHWSKRLHPGTSVASLEFCPTERVVLTTTSEWGAIMTKLSVPRDWKVWQLYMVLIGMFVASAVACYIFFLFSDSFWKLPSSNPTPQLHHSFVGDHASDEPFVVDL